MGKSSTGMAILSRIKHQDEELSLDCYYGRPFCRSVKHAGKILDFYQSMDKERISDNPADN